MHISPSQPSSPREQLTFQYKDRDQRLDIQQTMRTMRYFHPDVTSISYFEKSSNGIVENPYGGIARIELSSLRSENERPETRQTMLQKVQSASTWLVEKLRKLGLLPQEE